MAIKLGGGFGISASTSAMQTWAMNAAARWLALGFIGDGGTADVGRIYCSAINGSPGSNSLACQVYSATTAGIPNAAVGTQAVVTPSVGWRELSGMNYVTTAGTQYFLVFKNLDGSPTTNYPTLQFGPAFSQFGPSGSGSNVYGWTKHDSTNSGSSWTNSQINVAGAQVGYTDGSYDGIALQTLSEAAHIYGAASAGIYFTTPPGAKLRVRGFNLYFQTSTGGPSQNVFGRLLSSGATSPTVIATSINSVRSGLINGGNINFYFATPQVLEPNTSYRFVGATSGSDTSSNAYRLRFGTIDSDAKSLGVMPMSCRWTETTNGTNWTETASKFCGFGVLLDHANEISSSGGGGSSISNLSGNF